MIQKSFRDIFAEVYEPASGWTDQKELDHAIKAVSPIQRQVIEKLYETRSSMIRLPGGFWTYDGCGVNAAGIPMWFVQTATVMAMDRAGLLVRSEFYVESWRDHRTLPPSEKAVS